MTEEQKYVEKTLGDSIICLDCSCTLATFADACTADLDDPCPGYIAIDNAKLAFQRGGKS